MPQAPDSEFNVLDPVNDLDPDPDLADHIADTTDVHGIASAAGLATDAEVAAAIAAHEADTSNVHGITDTTTYGDLATTDDVDDGDAATLEAAQDYSDGPLTVTTQTANYSLVQADQGTLVRMNSASAREFTVDQLTAGTVINTSRVGAGTVTHIAGSGVTLRVPYGADIGTQYGGAELVWHTATEVVCRADD
jgi:hypothetical protein